MKTNVKVFIEIDFHQRIEVDIRFAVINYQIISAIFSQARLQNDVERRARGGDQVSDFFPLQSYAYQQSAFFSMMDNIPDLAKLHTEFACKVKKYPKPSTEIYIRLEYWHLKRPLLASSRKG